MPHHANLGRNEAEWTDGEVRLYLSIEPVVVTEPGVISRTRPARTRVTPPGGPSNV